MSRLTIAIPWLGTTELFEQTLVSVLQNRPEDCEIMVVHSEPYEDPYDIAQEVRLIEAPGAKSVCELLNLGFAQADTEWVHVLACGCEVAEGWVSEASEHFDNPRTSIIAPLVLESADSGSRIGSAGASWSLGGGCRRLSAGRRWREGRAPRHRIESAVWEAGFYRRQAVLDAGGFDAKVGDQLAPFDLALTLAQLDQRAELAAGSHVYRSSESDSSPVDFGSGLHAERLFWRHAGGSGAAGFAAAMALHAAAVTATTLGRLIRSGGWLELAGRFVATLEFGTRSRQRRRLQRVASTLNLAEPELSVHRGSTASEESRTVESEGDEPVTTEFPRQSHEDYESRRAA